MQRRVTRGHQGEGFLKSEIPIGRQPTVPPYYHTCLFFICNYDSYLSLEISLCSYYNSFRIEILHLHARINHPSFYPLSRTHTHHTYTGRTIMSEASWCFVYSKIALFFFFTNFSNLYLFLAIGYNPFSFCSSSSYCLLISVDHT